jgi:hypothetical protein
MSCGYILCFEFQFLRSMIMESLDFYSIQILFRFQFQVSVSEILFLCNICRLLIGTQGKHVILMF